MSADICAARSSDVGSDALANHDSICGLAEQFCLPQQRDHAVHAGDASLASDTGEDALVWVCLLSTPVIRQVTQGMNRDASNNNTSTCVWCWNGRYNLEYTHKTFEYTPGKTSVKSLATAQIFCMLLLAVTTTSQAPAALSKRQGVGERNILLRRYMFRWLPDGCTQATLSFHAVPR